MYFLLYCHFQGCVRGRVDTEPILETGGEANAAADKSFQNLHWRHSPIILGGILTSRPGKTAVDCSSEQLVGILFKTFRQHGKHYALSKLRYAMLNIKLSAVSHCIVKNQRRGQTQTQEELSCQFSKVQTLHKYKEAIKTSTPQNIKILSPQNIKTSTPQILKYQHCKMIKHQHGKNWHLNISEDVYSKLFCEVSRHNTNTTFDYRVVCKVCSDLPNRGWGPLFLGNHTAALFLLSKCTLGCQLQRPRKETMNTERINQETKINIYLEKNPKWLDQLLEFR